MCPDDVADVVNLGLIPSSEAGWSVACRALKKNEGGILHIHANVNCLIDTETLLRNNNSNELTSRQTEYQCKGGDISDHFVCNNYIKDWLSLKSGFREYACYAANKILHLLQSTHRTIWNCEIQHVEHVKNFAPYVHHIVVDLECHPV